MFFDLTFVREGRPLHDWLPDLVADDHAARHAAANALGGMWHGRPRYDSDWKDFDPSTPVPDLMAQGELFQEAVRDAVERPDFPKAIFVRRLIIYRMSLKRDWLDRVRQMTMHDAKYNRHETKLLERALTSGDEADRDQAMSRFTRLLCASIARDEKICSGAETSAPAGFVSYLVFESLGSALLAAEDVLGEMLEGPSRDEALGALKRAGPPAKGFARRLLEQLDSMKRFDATQALGSIIRGDPDLAAAVLARLRHESMNVRQAAAETLREAGPDLGGCEPEAIRILMGMMYDPELMYVAVGAAASVGRERPDIAQRVAELARWREPRLQLVYEGTQWQGEMDATMWERGAALSAMAYMPRFADLFIPILVDAIETFQEYNPDESYEAEHGRVCRVLQTFGPAAAPAVPALIAYLERWLAEPADQREWPKYVLETLKAMGPAAAAALPVLRRLRDAIADEETSEQWDPEDPLDSVILALSDTTKP